MEQSNNKRMRQALKVAAITAFIAAASPAMGQIQIDGYDYYLPKVFSSTGKPQIVVQDFNEDNSKTFFRIYNENLEKTKEMEVASPKSITRIVTEERKAIPGEYEDKIQHTDTTTVDNLSDAIERASGYSASSYSVVNGIYTFMPEYTPMPGGSYYQCTYNESTKVFIAYTMVKDQKYSDEWTVINERERTYFIAGGYSVYVVNYDESIPADFDAIKLSQTLFNTDDKYEYMVSVNELEAQPSDYSDMEFDMSGQSIKREAYCYFRQTATNVVSEDGNVMYTFPGDVYNIIIIGGKTYAVGIIYEDDNDGTPARVYYEIDRQANSIRKVMSEEVRIHPRVAKRSENITIETGTGLDGQKRDVIVTSMDGRTIERRTIPSGVTSTQISTARMTSGVYNFTVYANGKKLENGKIIVK